MNQKELKLSLNRISIRLRLRHPRLQRGASAGTSVSAGLRKRFLGEIQGFNLLRDRMIRSISVDCPSLYAKEMQFDVDFQRKPMIFS